MRANLDLRYYQAFPPVVTAGSLVPLDHVPYQGCGTPQAPCTDGSMPQDVRALLTKYRGNSLAGLGSTDWQEFWSSPAGRVLRIGTAVAGGIHGYRRNKDSVGWAIAWVLGGLFFMPVAAIVMGAQTAKYGYGKAPRG